MYLEDMHLGMEIDIPEVTIRKEQMIEFAHTYDPFPLHYDEQYAAKTRYGKLIAPGVMSFMLVWAEFERTGFFGDELIAGRSTRIEWNKPVYAGDALKGTARITAVTPRNEYNGAIEITIRVYNQQGELVLTDVTESVIQRRR